MIPYATSSRRAVTLLELMLVLTIMVAIVGLAMPTFDSMISSRKLSQATDKIQNEIMGGRVAAMRTGQAQVFQVTLGSSDYSITPWLGGNEEQDAAAGATIRNSGGQIVETDPTAGGLASEPMVEDDVKQLEGGVTFSAVETLVDSRNALAIEQSGGAIPAAGGAQAASGISSPLLLYPDGSCTTGQVILVDERGRRMAIQIRGVTGQLKVFRLTSVDAVAVAPSP